MKKILLFFVLFLTPIMDLYLSASDSSEGGGAIFYYDTIICSECTETAYLYNIDVSDWHPSNYVECKDTPRYNDTVMERDIDKLYKCFKCHVETEKKIIESQVICDHP